MASIDPKVAAVLDRAPANLDSDDEDALIASLEEDDGVFDALREKRLQQLHSEMSRARDMRNVGHGLYSEIKEEKELMDITTSTQLCVVHFFKPDFNRCMIMNTHLEALAPKHTEARFLRINVDNAPFLVTKMKVQVLPCVMGFREGVSVDRIIGFEGLSFGDTFRTGDLEQRLLQAGVLARAKMNEDDELERRQRAVQPKKEESDWEDDD